MGSLRINKVKYNGDKYYFESPVFTENVILIEGDNGTGKTTFCNLIYYGLGGRVKEFLKEEARTHKEIVNDTNNYVDLYISINTENYHLRRFIGDNDITVSPFTISDVEPPTPNEIETNLVNLDGVELLPVNRSFGNRIFSDWVLEKLNISVIELYQGYSTFKVNFTELFRLIYHDQQPNPELIYKQIDTKSNYISDSELLRKAIFEQLIGKSSSEYYDAIVEAKKAEKEKLLAKHFLDEFEPIIAHLRGAEKVINKPFLMTELEQKEMQLEKLHYSREAFKNNRTANTTIDIALDDSKSIIISDEIGLSESKEKLLSLFDEKSKLFFLKENTAKEITQVIKVIHAHDQLNLFSADTCPYCLTKVERVSGHCVCGAEIDEQQYERFFYTSQEYKEILKSKTKTVSTIELAIKGCEEDITSVNSDIEQLTNNIQNAKKKLRSILDSIDQPIDIETLNNIDDKILSIREQISLLNQKIELENKYEKLSSEYEVKRKAHQSAELIMQGLEVKAKQEIVTKVNDFSDVYNLLMTETLEDCRSARISLDTYLPVINDGEYKEASSGVSIRLMYYLTLLTLSLEDENVPFPHFLLIDTPETAGIELSNLKNCLDKFSNLQSISNDYQVIITTGLSKYPESLANNRVIYLPNKANALLKTKSQSQPL
ncbi:AAA family ATPase [Methylophilus aquaticus]|uniref:AAA family ATPase n=1 Tax=Methylophilus aquaticus TaxID=1971610 RepID=A0ABT9JTP8_9PROT|nr:AAA family ATPase [Methylophilus aquaticus]MDP8567963.1 AAA family ATPase [Methylophilus aquaticus]